MTVVKRKRFAGMSVLITGGAGGIGRAVAEGFTDEGAHVSTVDPVGGDFAVSVTDRAGLDEVCALVAGITGGIDVLVCLAGGSLGTSKDLDAPEADLDKVLDVNVKGTILACQAAMPYLRARKGNIVACGSIGGRRPSPVTGLAYATAKAAIGGLVRKLARELGADGVRVNAVAPGLFLTERVKGMFDGLSEEDREGVLDAIALRRMPDLRELVDPLLFLASGEASYITGVTLDVNGGRYMPL